MTNTELLTQDPAQMDVATFTDADLLDQLIEKISDRAKNVPADPSTDAGRKELKSMARKVSSSKTALISHGKGLTEEWRKKTSAVNESCKLIETRLDALRDEIKAPAIGFEEAEKRRVADHESCILDVRMVAQSAKPSSGVEFLKGQVEIARENESRDFQEFQQEYNAALAEAIAVINSAIEEAEKHGKDKAELEELRAEKEKRDREEQERLEAERVEREAKAAEEARVKREAEIKEQAARDAEKAAQDKIDALEAEKKAMADKAAAEEYARIEEEARIEKEKAALIKKEAEEKAAREADIEHRKSVNNAAVNALIDGCNCNPETAKEIITLIALGNVPNVSIEY